MNAGDSFFDNKVLSNLFRNDLKNIDLFYGNHAVKNENTSFLKEVNVKKNNYKRNIPFCHQSLFVKTSLLKNNLFDLQFKIAADYNQFLRLKSKKINILHIPIIISIYLDGGISSVSRKKLIEEYYSITKKYFPVYAKFVYIIRILKYKFFGK